MAKKRMIIFDCDIICYRASAVVEKRTIKVTHIKSNKVKEFNTRTEFKEYLKDLKYEYVSDDYEIVDIQTPEDIKVALAIVKNQIDDIISRTWADETLFYISGKNNFRDSLPLPTKYKGTRENTIRPILLPDVRQYVVDKYKAKIINDMEVDDMVIISGYEYLKKGYDVTIITNDKDSKAYSGLKIFDFTKGEDAREEVLPQFGKLWIDEKTKKPKGNGFIWFCFQWVNGDITDCFKPSELSGDKFGDMSSYNLLKDCKDEKEAIEAVIGQYKKWYPKQFAYDDWQGKKHKVTYKHMLDLYFKCCRMKETTDDTLDYNKFVKKYGVKQ